MTSPFPRGLETAYLYPKTLLLHINLRKLPGVLRKSLSTFKIIFVSLSISVERGDKPPADPFVTLCLIKIIFLILGKGFISFSSFQLSYAYL